MERLDGCLFARGVCLRGRNTASTGAIPSNGGGDMAKAEQKAQEMFVRYSDEAETIQRGEAETLEQIAATLLDIAKKVGERQRHTVRAVHAKSHGLLKAEVTVLADLREELRQGLFAKTSELQRGHALLERTGRRTVRPHLHSTRSCSQGHRRGGRDASNHASQVTQDFVLNNASTFAANADDFLKAIRLRAKHADDPEALKQAVSSVAQTAEKTLELFGQKSAFLKGFGHPPTHPLGETYHTAAPLRFGDYFGKRQLAPVSDNLIALRGKHVDHPHSWNCLKDSIVAFFQRETAVWELRVQLCTDLTKMPVEDASVEWDERLSPLSNGCPDHGATSKCLLGCPPGLG